jgi:hypothetical protein
MESHDRSLRLSERMGYWTTIGGCLALLFMCGLSFILSTEIQERQAQADQLGTVPCPVVALSAITDEQAENGYTCVTVNATLGKVFDLEMDPPRYTVLLNDRGTVVQGVWAGPRETLQEGAKVTVRGAVVQFQEWGVWLYSVKPWSER